MLEIVPGILIPAVITALGVALALVFLLRPSYARDRGGVLVGAVGFVAVPLLVLVVGSEKHLIGSKKTEFCLSCHVMHPYGGSLMDEGEEFLAAIHYSHHYVPPDSACYSCHTQYTMYGGLAAKMKGLKHLWVNYFDDVVDPIELYDAYSNRECLHCHEGGKAFEEAMLHADQIAEFRSDEVSCLDCHAPAHGVEEGAVSEARSGAEFPLPPTKKERYQSVPGDSAADAEQEEDR